MRQTRMSQITYTTAKPNTGVGKHIYSEHWNNLSERKSKSIPIYCNAWFM